MASDLASLLHAFLFSEGGSLTYKKLAKLAGVDEVVVKDALKTLQSRLESSGLTIVQSETEASLVIDQEVAPVIQNAFSREFGSEIGDAGLEVLAVVLYRGPSTRAQIDYIRGVNTSSTIRSLLSRGLLERTGNPDDGREYLYRPTVELLAHLGIRDVSELPDRDRVTQELSVFESSNPEASGAQADAPLS